MPTIQANGRATRTVVVRDRRTVAVGGQNAVELATPQAQPIPVRERVRTIGVSSPGIQGPRGEPGAGGDAVVIPVEAGQALGGHRIVRLVAGKVWYADATIAGHADAVFGMTTQAANAGETVQVLTAGRHTEPSWAWTPDDPLFLGENGQLIQSPLPGAAFDLVLGFADGADSAYIDLQPPIFTED